MSAIQEGVYNTCSVMLETRIVVRHLRKELNPWVHTMYLAGPGDLSCTACAASDTCMPVTTLTSEISGGRFVSVYSK